MQRDGNSNLQFLRLSLHKDMYTKYHYDIIGQDNHSFDLKFFLEKNQGWIIFCAFNFDKEEIIQRGNSTNLILEIIFAKIRIWNIIEIFPGEKSSLVLHYFRASFNFGRDYATWWNCDVIENFPGEKSRQLASWIISRIVCEIASVPRAKIGESRMVRVPPPPPSNEIVSNRSNPLTGRRDFSRTRPALEDVLLGIGN